MTRNLRKTAVLALLIVLAAFATAACGSDDPDTIVLGPDDPVQVRTLISLDAESLRAGVELAVGHFGAVHGHEVELGPVVDSMCDPDGGRAGAERIAAEPEVLGVVGTSCSASSVTAMPVLSAAGLVMVSPAATSPVLTSDLRGNPGADYHPGFFRVVNNDLYQAEAVAGFAYHELGLRRTAAVHDGDPYTSALARAFRSAFAARGGDVPFTGTVEKGQTDMAGVLLGVAGAAPDSVFFPLFDDEAAHFIRQARESDGLEGVTYITADAALTSAFLAVPESEGVYFAAPPPHEESNFNAATGRTVDEALAAYAAAYPELAQGALFWMHAYDATTLLLAAIERAAVRDDGNFFTRFLGIDERGTLRVNRSALRGAIRAVSEDFSGLTGTLACDEFGDCGSGVQAVYHHTDATVTDPGELPVVYRFEP